MRDLVITDEANEDMAALFTYIADAATDAIGRRFVEQLTARFHRIADLPGTLGTDRSDLAPALRSTPYQGYVIYFRYEGDAVEIVNVLDARRDVAAHFSPQDRAD